MPRSPVVMAMLAACRGRVGAGSAAPLGVHPTRGSLRWGSGRRVPRPPSRERGDGAMWAHFAARRSGYRRPRPLPRCPFSQRLSARLRLPWAGTPPRPGARGPDVQRGPWGTRSREGCRLTARSGADPGRSSRVCAGSQRLRLERQIVLGGRWAPGTSSGPSSFPVLETDKLFIGTTHSWKCELASPSYTPTGSWLACGL